ncbi:MAG: hypothetical protein CFE31_19350 [Rhizobiales bacterium PAR1]|nr:MAG: hypothetical protein CFE31_19350 [Rhizobiales bacterium PAR1]
MSEASKPDNNGSRDKQLVPWVTRFRSRTGLKKQKQNIGTAMAPVLAEHNAKIAGPASTSVRVDEGEASVFARNIWKSFLAFVLLPALLYLVYATFFATRVYVSEFKLVVRSAERNESLKDGLSSLTRLARVESTGSHQEAQIVISYVKSRAIIEDLGSRETMLRYFGRSDIDFFSRLGKNKPIEDIFDYWISRVTATIDALTGIITIRVRAFSATEAQEIANKVIANSETLINNLSVRTRNDALKQSMSEVDRAAASLASIRQELLEFRNRSGMIDPVGEVKSLGSVIVALTLQKTELEAQAASTVGTLAINSVVERQRRAQIESLNEKIEELKGKLTNNEAKDAVSQKLKEFEQVKLRVLFAEKIFELTQKEYETARKDSARQQFFVAAIVAPTLADSPTYPKIFSEFFLVFVVLVVGWGIIVLLVGSILDHSY